MTNLDGRTTVVTGDGQTHSSIRQFTHPSDSAASHLRLDLLPPRGCCDLAHARESTLTVLLVRSLDVVHGVTDERPLRHNRRALGLAGIEHEARAFLLCSDADDAHTLTARSIDPSTVMARDRHRVFTKPHGTIYHEHESVVRHRQGLF